MRYLYDTNVFLYYLAGEPKIRRLFTEQFLNENRIVTSAIVRIELLSFPNLTDKEDLIIREMLRQFEVLAISSEIEDIAVVLRRKYRLRIPDAIVAATAYHTSSIVMTRDIKDFKRINEIQLVDPF
ncbi:MAG: type II toxin-antitoxin system VapC family toxin [Ignavibacteriales bacterium]|nr:type II toxin-antitoxin system VapC family toxin [Ignavibacteriales bacterium]